MGKCVDSAAVMQVIGNIYNNPNLLDASDKYFFNEEDFPEDFHRIVFGSILNLHELGAKHIDKITINDYLKDKPKSLAIYEKFRGDEYLDRLSTLVQSSSFDYYYGRLKKFSLLRAYEKVGLDISEFYDYNNITDTKKKQTQEEWLDRTNIEDIAALIDDRITAIRLKYVDDFQNDSVAGGEGINDLIQRLMEAPEVGVPLYGNLINTVTRGARLRKFYLRSAASGYGKTRSMIADFCYIGCDEIWDEKFDAWISTGLACPAIYITIEQDLEEIQTMMLAFLSNVNEEHIVTGQYAPGELEKVRHAAEVIGRSPVYIEELHDFSLQDVENVIKRNIRQHDCNYVFFDYVATSMKILAEVSGASGVRLREDNILFMMSTRLKDICNEYGVFIESATQLNGEWKTEKMPDQNLLRGAKSIADKIDFGCIILPVNDEDLAALDPILKTQVYEVPNAKISIYKNRRGRYKSVYMWCKSDLGTCRIRPMFVTDWEYKFIDTENIQVIVEGPSAF